MVYAELMGAGLIAGFLAGLLGIGGGFVVVPVLLLLLPTFGIPPALLPKVAVATSLATMIPTAIAAVHAQSKRGAIDYSWVRRVVPGAGAGAALGALVAAAIPAMWVALVFASYAGFFAVKMIVDRPPAVRPRRPLTAMMTRCPTLVGTFIGCFSAIAGIGGASLTVPYLLANNVEMKRAVASASAVGLGIAVMGAFSFAFGSAKSDMYEGSPMLVGFVCWPAALILGAGSILMAPRGVAASHQLSVRQLKRGFGAVLVAASVMTLAKVAPPATIALHANNVSTNASTVR